MELRERHHVLPCAVLDKIARMVKIVISRRDSLQAIEVDDAEFPVSVENDGGLVCVYDQTGDDATPRLRAAVPMTLVTSITTVYSAL